MAAAPPSTPLPPLTLVEFRSRQQSDRGSIYRKPKAPLLRPPTPAPGSVATMLPAPVRREAGWCGPSRKCLNRLFFMNSFYGCVYTMDLTAAQLYRNCAALNDQQHRQPKKTPMKTELKNRQKSGIHNVERDKSSRMQYCRSHGGPWMLERQGSKFCHIALVFGAYGM
ncbi:hypothetical protein UY3_10938 [Chelonia mydas]|uniref:Uncharacterized protein n=1 Tax=Chelonia mydas TaxID=8469 RepID=M7BUV5_CHEMY|nr:hypothetical protein UY3_10938 [Chelonia mydas]